MEVLDSRCRGTDSSAEKQPLPVRQSSFHISRKTSWGTPIPPPSDHQTIECIGDKNEGFDAVDLESENASLMLETASAWSNLTALGLAFTSDTSKVPLLAPTHRFSLDESEIVKCHRNIAAPHGQFDKWMRSLHQRATARRKTVNDAIDHAPLEGSDSRTGDKQEVISRHKKSSSSSSLGFVTAVKSASISLASFNMAQRCRRTGVSSRHQNRSSQASNSGLRHSEDSSYPVRAAIIDQAVINRSIQRRKILEEIIGTEESYAADIKFLMNVYVTILASMPTLSIHMRSSISSNLNEIVDLHEELLGDLHRAVPHSEFTQPDLAPAPTPQAAQVHHRWQSLDAVPELHGDMSYLQKIPGLMADANVAAEVAKVFGKKMHRFFVYEEYGAKYEMMVKDVSVSYKTIPQWELYQKGLEALGKSLASHNNQSEHVNKSMTFGDLLVKPIQRVCRYPLLFVELLKQTPVCDCPDSHMEIEKVLLRLRETTAAINRATNDPRVKETMEKTWLLQDRLIFPDQTEAHSKNALRALGHVQLCGVLHGAWQTRDGVDGQNLISILYRDFFVLATAGKADQTYTIQTCIGLGDIRVEEADNGRGLQCHTAPYSWKVVFEYDHQLYEIIFSACTPKEELEWRTRLNDRVYRDQIEGFEVAFFTSLSLGVKPLGTVFGKPGTIARRLSIHRATTVGPKSSLCQVIIKNTSAWKDIPHSSSSTSINRSQSLLTTNRIPVVASSRGERVRLENIISDVWTRDVLPFPSMTGRSRGEHLVRASASSMIRKLSVASIASNFTKRSGSQPSLVNLNEPVDGDFEIADTKILFTGGYGNTIRDELKSNPIAEFDEAMPARKPAIELEKLQTGVDPPNTLICTGVLNEDTPISTMRRLATLRIHRGFHNDGARNITPPLRTSSANSIRVNRIPSGGTVSFDSREKENKFQSKHSKWSNSVVLNKGLSTEGLRGFFR